MSAYDRKHQHPEPRPVQKAEPVWLRRLFVAVVSVVAIFTWAVLIWGVAAVIDWIVSLFTLLLALADKVVAAR